MNRLDTTKLLLLGNIRTRLERLNYQKLRLKQESNLNIAKDLRQCAVTTNCEANQKSDTVDLLETEKYRAALFNRATHAEKVAKELQPLLAEKRNRLVDAAQFEQACKTLAKSAEQKAAKQARERECLQQEALHLLKLRNTP